MGKIEDDPATEPAKKREPITYVVLRFEQDETEPAGSGAFRIVGTYDALSRRSAASQYVDQYHGGTPPDGLRFAVVAESSWEEFAPKLVQQPRLVW